MRTLFMSLSLLMFGACASDEDAPPITPDADVSNTDLDTVPNPDGSEDASDSIAPSDVPDLIEPCGGACLLGEICIENQCVCDPSPVSFKEDLVKPMQTTCGPGCHVSEEENGGYQRLNLHENFAYRALIDVPTTACDGTRTRVRPGSIRDSYIYNKLTDTDLCDEGQAMPIGRMPWPEARIAALGRWICQGALDN